jgi:hypothetical protein
MNQPSEGLLHAVAMPSLTRHAELRMQQRGIQSSDIELAVRYGRRIHAKGLTYYVVGRKEVKRQAQAGENISRLSGLQVLVQETEGVVVTTYRNTDFHTIRSTPRDKRRFRSQSGH